ncbi:DUF6460 domain-containing protein [uncultured Roseibium sp.]|uniref:DUF6460 domain-containing protein n=1 Tax=uncultured Roseibium sp. TaxID=1936171 RepID=UPI003216F8C0
MSDSSLTKFLGGSPGQVILRLLFLSFVVGVILSALDLNPLDIIDIATRFVQRLWNMGFAAIENILRYFAIGAVIVVPIWLILRLIKSVGR